MVRIAHFMYHVLNGLLVILKCVFNNRERKKVVYCINYLIESKVYLTNFSELEPSDSNIYFCYNQIYFDLYFAIQFAIIKSVIFGEQRLDKRTSSSRCCG